MMVDTRHRVRILAGIASLTMHLSVAAMAWQIQGPALRAVAADLRDATSASVAVRRVRSILQASVVVEIPSIVLPPGVKVRVGPGVLEPGVVGIWRHVLLLPADIEVQLTPEQFAAIVAHELHHIRYRDNLTATPHMLVEAIFWFHPLVWWIGARLVEQRERACDEDVLRRSANPRPYADGILHVCRRYVDAHLACVSGVSGADLEKRIAAIMSERIGEPVTRAALSCSASRRCLPSSCRSPSVC